MAIRTDPRPVRLFALTASLILLTGCSSNSCVEIAGEVTFDGRPLQRGTIVFTPENPEAGPSTGCDIVDGKYQVPAAKGVQPGTSYRVQIASLAKSGKFIPNPFDRKGPPLEVEENFLPPSYNTQSILKIAVGTGTQNFNFALYKEGSVPR